jgi:transcriptional regulator with XRE-family HTH domain
MKAIANTPGSRLRAMRKRRKLSILQLAIELRQDPGNLSRVERDKSPLGIKLAKSVSAFFGASLDYLYNGKETK